MQVVEALLWPVKEIDFWRHSFIPEIEEGRTMTVHTYQGGRHS